jgi:hypothetical protein
MITLKQIKKIHALKNRLGWSDAEYREYLMAESDGFITSSKELSEEEAERLIQKMEYMAIARAVWKKYEGKRKYEDLGNRPYMASPAQLRKIEAMWKEICRKDERTRLRALRTLLEHKFKVSDIRFLEEHQVRKVLKLFEQLKMKGKDKA